MAPDPQSDRLRLVIEPGENEYPEDDEAVGLIGRFAAQQRRPEDLVDEDETDEAPAPTPARHRRLLPGGLAALALVAFAGVIWYAYNWGVGAIDPEELPVIHADSGPIKIRPEEPGGLEVPNQDKLVLNEIRPDPEKPQVERLLPPPEVPKPALAQAPVKPPSGEAQSAAPAPDPAASAGAPAGSETPPTLHTAAGPEAPPEPPVAAPAPAGPQVAAVPSGAFVVQIASMRTADAAEREWTRLRAAYPDLLGERTLVVQSVDLAGKGTYHRVQAGTFTERGGAEALCARLKARKQDCLVVRR